MNRKKLVFCLLLPIFLSFFFRLPASAEEQEAVTMPSDYTALPDVLPPEIEGLLPDGLFSENVEEALSATTELTEWRYLLGILASA